MPSYVYQVCIKLNEKAVQYSTDSVVSLLDDTILFKCERKARKFVLSLVDQYKGTGDWCIWQPSKFEWVLQSDVTGAQLTITLKEVYVRTYV